MNEAERQTKVEAMKTERLGSLETHIAALEKLTQTTGFDFDIATDLDPSLIDDSSENGREKLKFWQEFYEKLQTHPKYFIVSKYSIGTQVGCYGFGQEAKYEVTNTYLRLFENLPEDAVVFERNEEGEPRVVINHPSELVEYHRSSGATSTSTDQTILFDSTFSVLARHQSEGSQSLVARVFTATDFVSLLHAQSDARQVDSKDMAKYRLRGGIYLSGALHGFDEAVDRERQAHALDA